MRKLTRRELLKLMGTAAGASALSALVSCRSAPPNTASLPASTPVAEQATAAPASPTQETVLVDIEDLQKCEVDWNTRMPPVPKKYDPPVEIAIEFERFPEYPDGDSSTNHPKYNWIKENMGIVYTVHWHADRDTEVFTQKRNADIASGTLADRMGVGGTQLADMIANDAVAEIREIWEATASPLVKEKRRYPDGDNWIPVWRGDKLYGVPFQWGGDGNVDSIGWIRKDWLDKVGLGVPDTLEDIDRVLRAWKDAGLCAYGLNAANSPFTWNHRLDVFFGAFGHMPTTWRDFGDGKLVYDSLHPDNKKALELLRDWYAEGFMHPDFYTYAPWDANTVYTDQSTGLTYCPWWMNGTMRSIEETYEGAEVVNCQAPRGPDGLRGRVMTNTIGNAIVYRAGLDPIKIEATINELNWHTELLVNGPEKYDAYGQGLVLEGYDYEWDENCELVAGKYATNGLNRSIGWNFDFLAYPDSIKDGNVPLLKWAAMDPSQLNKYQRFLISDPATITGAEVYQQVMDTMDMAIGTKWIGVPTERMVRLSPDMPNEDQMYISIITGNAGMDMWDQWEEDWHAMGGDEIAEDINAWYDTVK
jgi:putative aldouronate transport system substrate-binding protein